MDRSIPSLPKILILNGPNLNLLGRREPHLYGHMNYNQLTQDLIHKGKELGYEVLCKQSNQDN